MQDFTKMNSPDQNSREYKLSISVRFPTKLPEFIEKQRSETEHANVTLAPRNMVFKDSTHHNCLMDEI
jgi:hypothetical protein